VHSSEYQDQEGSIGEKDQRFEETEGFSSRDTTCKGIRLSRGLVLPVLASSEEDSFWLFEVTRTIYLDSLNDENLKIHGFYLNSSSRNRKFERNPKKWNDCIHPNNILTTDQGVLLFPEFSKFSRAQVVVEKGSFKTIKHWATLAKSQMNE
jgi:hypothetical protein